MNLTHNILANFFENFFLKSLMLGSLLLGLYSPLSWSQLSGTGQSGYDDYGSFATDPVDLDNEYAEVFGRFFQVSFHLGTGILTGGLGDANSAGLLLGTRFIFYFDKQFAAELSVSYANHSGLYNAANTGSSGINIDESTSLIPLSVGVRYAFDQDALPRGFSSMNPFIVAAGELVFRSEHVNGSPNTKGAPALSTLYLPGAIINSTAFGVSFGGGVEFDVYRKKLYLGLDLRYHMMFWSDASTLFGNLDRRGNYITLLGTVSYNY